ncbi:MAG: hypothetical protein K9G36_01620 [Crocinitomicaceae bacterium]|nr:hypothetical protein [Crocinitomicaceae bacterium]MCF8444254.1 hypothetical protein [Crocinitomicaceae bacterium]
MMIKDIYRKPFKKTPVFLYPLINIKPKSGFVPELITPSMDNLIAKADAKLVCLYDRTEEGFEHFATKIIKTREQFQYRIDLNESWSVFIFEMNDDLDSWNAFLKWKYSQMSDKAKKQILNYFNYNLGNQVYVDSYLNPEKHFENYAKILMVETSLLKQVVELCDKPNFSLEHLNTKKYTRVGCMV